MKIETLLRAYTQCLDEVAYCRRVIKRNRQARMIKRGIIRKFNRLEKELAEAKKKGWDESDPNILRLQVFPDGDESIKVIYK